MEFRFASRMSRFTSSAVRDILKLTQGRDIISFSGGLPAEELFPAEELKSAFSRVFADRRVMQYGLTEGLPELRQLLSQRLAGKGIQASPDQLLITSGSQQSIDLTARILLEPGDLVITENPTYLAALQVFQSSGATILGLDTDENGIRPDLLEAALRDHQPKLLYVIPTFANPTGAIWSLERRQEILSLCTRYETMILEDDPYGELSFEAEALPPSLKALADAAGFPGVIYTSTFSKTVVPALRIGWTAADEAVIRQLAKAKQTADLHSSCLDQAALAELLKTFDLDGHIRRIRLEYATRMKTMLEVLRSDPAFGEIIVRTPKGGMFLWLELPGEVDMGTLLRLAVEEGVAFVPGTGFHTDGRGSRTIRLNFSHSAPEVIREGMLRLKRAYIRCRSVTGAEAATMS
jgi:2-aminoadipate transaminase